MRHRTKKKVYHTYRVEFVVDEEVSFTFVYGISKDDAIKSFVSFFGGGLINHIGKMKGKEDDTVIL